MPLGVWHYLLSVELQYAELYGNEKICTKSADELASECAQTARTRDPTLVK